MMQKSSQVTKGKQYRNTTTLLWQSLLCLPRGILFIRKGKLISREGVSVKGAYLTTYKEELKEVAELNWA